MKSDSWAQLAQIVSAFAIVAGLVYVGRVLDENSRMAQVETHRSILGLKHEWDSWLITDSALAALVTRAIDLDTLVADSLSPAEYGRFERYVTSGLNIWDHAYYGRRNEILGVDEWGGWDSSFGQRVLQGAWTRVWVKERRRYGDEFRQHVDSLRTLVSLGDPATLAWLGSPATLDSLADSTQPTDSGGR